MMTFKYSICYPDKENIEYRNRPISGNEALEIARKYPWLAQLKLLDSIAYNKVHYNPSLDFTCLENKRSFCLTAEYDEKQELKFSLWYNRPKKVKVLFGLLGEREKMVVDDIWSFDFNDSINYLEMFVEGKYNTLEKLFEKK